MFTISYYTLYVIRSGILYTEEIITCFLLLAIRSSPFGRLMMFGLIMTHWMQRMSRDFYIQISLPQRFPFTLQTYL